MKPRTFHRAPRDLVGGTVHRQRGVRPCRREDRVGLFKNEAVATVSLFCIGAVKTELDVVEVVFEWVHWYSCERLRSSLFHQAPEEFERTYCDEISGSLPDAVAHKTAAWFAGRCSHPYRGMGKDHTAAYCI